MLIDNVMERFPISNTIPTPQNCLITDLRARGLSKHPLGNYIFSPNVISLINLGFYKPIYIWSMEQLIVNLVLNTEIIISYFQHIFVYLFSCHFLDKNLFLTNDKSITDISSAYLAKSSWYFSSTLLSIHSI